MRTMTRGLLFLASGLWLLACGQSSSTFHLTLPTSTPNGTLTASPTEPTAGYVSGTVVTLTAAPSSGFELGKWTGTDNDASVSLTNHVTMSAGKTVGVTFQQPSGPTYLVTITTHGDVSVTAGAVGSQSGPSYSAGTVVPLTASVGAGHTVSWSGTDNDASTATTNTVTIAAAPVTVSATAVCDTQCTLTVLVDFPDFGHVNVVDGSLSVNTSTSSTNIAITKGDTVTLTAHDTPSWPFQGWSSPASSTGTCTGTVVMTTDQTVSASFPDEPGTSQKCP